MSPVSIMQLQKEEEQLGQLSSVSDHNPKVGTGDKFRTIREHGYHAQGLGSNTSASPNDVFI